MTKANIFLIALTILTAIASVTISATTNPATSQNNVEFSNF